MNICVYIAHRRLRCVHMCRCIHVSNVKARSGQVLGGRMWVFAVSMRLTQDVGQQDVLGESQSS